MNLDDILKRFSTDLKVYIQQEVARQLARSSQPTQESQVSGGQDSTLAVADVSDELQALASLGASNPRRNRDLPQFEKDSMAPSTMQNSLEDVVQTNSNATSVSGDVLSDLSELQQSSHRDSSPINSDDFLSASTNIPSAISVADMSSDKPLSGLQLLLNKIRSRKNLSSNQ